MIEILLRFIGVLIVLIGVIFIYDARLITKSKFDFGNENNTTSGFKILGTLICLIGSLIIYLN